MKGIVKILITHCNIIFKSLKLRNRLHFLFSFPPLNDVLMEGRWISIDMEDVSLFKDPQTKGSRSLLELGSQRREKGQGGS